MSREIKKKKIDGVEYICTQFPPKKSLRILTRMTRFLGEPLAVLMKDDGKKGKMLDREITDDQIAGIVTSLGKSLGDDDLYEIAADICENVTADMLQLSGDNFDNHFTGPAGLKKIFKVVAFALEVNYGDFLGVLADMRGESAKG